MKVLIFVAFFIGSQAAGLYSSMQRRLAPIPPTERFEANIPQEAHPSQRQFRDDDRDRIGQNRPQDTPRIPFYSENQPAIQNDFEMDHRYAPLPYKVQPFPVIASSPLSYSYESHYIPASPGKFYYQLF